MFDINVNWTHFTPHIDPKISDKFEYIEMHVTVIPDWNVSVYLEWEPLDVVGDDPLYTVYYSEAELGPFMQLSPQPTSNLSFFTTWQIQDSRVFEQFFTIETRYSDGRIFRSKPKTPGNSLPKWHRMRYKDIIRRERILLEKFVGIDTIVFNPKYHGKRCEHCWDKKHLKITEDHCEYCYGQGYEGEYDTGIRTLFQYSSIDAQSNIGYQGRVESITITAWTVPFPVIHPDAILLRMNDRRAFSVQGHQGSTEILTSMQRQNVVIRELGRDAIENRLFNNKDVLDIWPRKLHVHH